MFEAYQQGIERYNSEHSADVEMPSREAITAEIGNPVEEIYQNLFPLLNGSETMQLGEFVVDVLLGKIESGGGTLAPGIKRVLSSLKNNYQLAVVTNADRAYLDRVVEAQELADYFTKLICAGDWPGESKGQLIVRMITRLKLKPQEVVMVGDRRSDQQAAEFAGTDFIGCLYGHGQLTSNNTVEIAEELIELLAFPAETS